MAETIRRLEDSDFTQVSALFNDRKSIRELKWLFCNYDDQNIYNAFVAIDEHDEIIGVIGYSISEYFQNDKTIIGIVPLSWKLSEEYKGFAGVQLFKKVISLGRISFAIDGTNIAQRLYPMFGYQFLTDNNVYYKILNIKNVCLSLKKKSRIKTIGFIGALLPTYLYNKQRKSQASNVSLVRYTGDNFKAEKEYKGVFRKKITKAYIDWLLGCPVLKTHAFCIFYNNVFLGICVLYVQKINEFNRGRIVHLPFLGHDLTIWTAVLGNILNFFRKEQCCFISALGQHTINKAAYRSTGFLSPKGYVRSVYLKDNDRILTATKPENMFLQYSEGDEAYISL